METPARKRPTLVAAGILVERGNVLICQRHRSDPYGLQWEFPGGKVEGNESLKVALARELAEELAIRSEIGDEVFRLEHEYRDRHVEVVFFRILSYEGPIENRVFERIEWAARSELKEYPFLAADQELVRRIASGEII